ncbi:uncharacterized protein K489DRAFT_383572 [Dissoconium aciculare CBS 342.82]|uniref:JmjC domain-containing protein n=1 Tax=Dissoconium aciculare CBS 342.82 TaxID=1314786 RepID=A0A6J3LXK6_9PEZI|nr:uncharacterized protein K489DRAFT_383572 [Dissoconium aciculare CBS 342.82]KAF1820024.1 hypothetical protein K489DRAFT_383572 [Dissoconium aciculare CBS 342.82]
MIMELGSEDSAMPQNPPQSTNFNHLEIIGISPEGQRYSKEELAGFRDKILREDLKSSDLLVSFADFVEHQGHDKDALQEGDTNWQYLFDRSKAIRASEKNTRVLRSSLHLQDIQQVWGFEFASSLGITSAASVSTLNCARLCSRRYKSKEHFVKFANRVLLIRHKSIILGKNNLQNLASTASLQLNEWQILSRMCLTRASSCVNHTYQDVQLCQQGPVSEEELHSWIYDTDGSVDVDGKPLNQRVDGVPHFWALGCNKFFMFHRTGRFCRKEDVASSYRPKPKRTNLLSSTPKRIAPIAEARPKSAMPMQSTAIGRQESQDWSVDEIDSWSFSPIPAATSDGHQDTNMISEFDLTEHFALPESLDIFGPTCESPQLLPAIDFGLPEGFLGEQTTIEGAWPTIPCPARPSQKSKAGLMLIIMCMAELEAQDALATHTKAVEETAVLPNAAPLALARAKWLSSAANSNVLCRTMESAKEYLQNGGSFRQPTLLTDAPGLRRDANEALEAVSAAYGYTNIQAIHVNGTTTKMRTRAFLSVFGTSEPVLTTNLGHSVDLPNPAILRHPRFQLLPQLIVKLPRWADQDISEMATDANARLRGSTFGNAGAFTGTYFDALSHHVYQVLDGEAWFLYASPNSMNSCWDNLMDFGAAWRPDINTRAFCANGGELVVIPPGFVHTVYFSQNTFLALNIVWDACSMSDRITSPMFRETLGTSSAALLSEREELLWTLMDHLSLDPSQKAKDATDVLRSLECACGQSCTNHCYVRSPHASSNISRWAQSFSVLSPLKRKRGAE